MSKGQTIPLNWTVPGGEPEYLLVCFTFGWTNPLKSILKYQNLSPGVPLHGCVCFLCWYTVTQLYLSAHLWSFISNFLSFFSLTVVMPSFSSLEQITAMQWHHLSELQRSRTCVKKQLTACSLLSVEILTNPSDKNKSSTYKTFFRSNLSPISTTTCVYLR